MKDGKNQQKVDLFIEKVQKMADEEFGFGDDEIRPRNRQLVVNVVDRSKFESFNYVPIPHGYLAETKDDFEKILNATELNLDLAHSGLQQFLRLRRFRMLKK